MSLPPFNLSLRQVCEVFLQEALEGGHCGSVHHVLRESVVHSHEAQSRVPQQFGVAPVHVVVQLPVVLACLVSCVVPVCWLCLLVEPLLEVRWSFSERGAVYDTQHRHVSASAERSKVVLQQSVFRSQHLPNRQFYA